MISKSSVAQYLAEPRDSFLWMKRLSRRQMLAEIDTLPVPYRRLFKTDPWLHQLVCFYLMARYRRFMLLLDMGLGKTKILCDSINYRKERGQLTRALVTVPRLVNLDSWQDDVAKHTDLSYWAANVKSIGEKWDRIAYPQGDVTTIDLAGLHLATTKKVRGKKKNSLEVDHKKIDHLKRQYNFLAIDEIHLVGNNNSLWWQVLDQLSENMDFVYGSTGTVISKRPESAFNQFLIVDRGATFGDSLGLFKSAFFTEKPDPWKGVVYEYDPRRSRQFNAIMQHRSLRYDEGEAHDLPLSIHRSKKLTMTDDQREHYLRAVEGVIQAAGRKSELKAPWTRMRQIASGYLAWKDENGDHLLPFERNPKLEALESLIDGIGSKKIIVSYQYTESARLVANRFKKLGIDFEWFYGGTKDHTASRRRFMDEARCQVFLMNSASGGTGTDGLQRAANRTVMYELPPDLTTYKQVMKRTNRSGQSEERTFIWDFIMRQSVEMTIARDLEAERSTFDAIVDGKFSSRSSLMAALLGEV